MELHELTIHAAHDLLKKKEVSAVELTRAVLDRVAALDDKVGAYITVTGEQALAQAATADRAIAAGKMTPLTGIPLAIGIIGGADGLDRSIVKAAVLQVLPSPNVPVTLVTPIASDP